MQLYKAEENLLIEIHEGRTLIEGPDVETLKMLMSRGFAIGKDGKEENYFQVYLTPIGQEKLAEILARRQTGPYLTE